jgi:hypothetical protein
MAGLAMVRDGCPTAPFNSGAVESPHQRGAVQSHAARQPASRPANVAALLSPNIPETAVA